MELYRAVVEDNNDPDKIGRVKVRIHGIHTEKNSNSDEEFAKIGVIDLPWAEVMGSTSFGLVGGVGISSILKQGTWVWVVLEMGDKNRPIIVGTMSGINSEDSKEKAKNGIGFFDPSEIYPFVNRSKESDLNRLSRNDKLTEPYYDEPSESIQSTDSTDTKVSLDTTIHDKINQTLSEVTETDSDSGASPAFKEPLSTSDKTEYPNSSILETSSGHVIELDDTTGNERVRVYHKTGSYIEIKPDGGFVQKSNGENGNYYIHASDVNELITGSVKKYVSENIDEIVKGYVKTFIEGERNTHIAGDSTTKIDANLTDTVGGNVTVDAGGNVEWIVGGNLTITVAGMATVEAGPKMDLKAGIININ